MRTFALFVLLLAFAPYVMGIKAIGIGRPVIVTADPNTATACNSVGDRAQRTDTTPDQWYECEATGAAGAATWTRLVTDDELNIGTGNSTTVVTSDEAAVSGAVPIYGVDGDGDVDTYTIKERIHFGSTNVTSTQCLGAGQWNTQSVCWTNDDADVQFSYSYFNASANAYVELFCCTLVSPLTVGTKTLELVHANLAGASASNPFNGASQQLAFSTTAGQGGTAGDTLCADIDELTGANSGRLAAQVVSQSTPTGATEITCFADVLHP